jgi:hypothetical protein
MNKLRPGDIIQINKKCSSHFDINGNLVDVYDHEAGDLAIFLRFGGKWFKSSICSCGSIVGKRHWFYIMTHRHGPCLISECKLTVIT